VKDPFIEEIRRVRRNLDKLFETDPRRFYAEMAEACAHHKGKIVSVTDPRKSVPRNGSRKTLAA
jgi:hypothetical protein